MRCGGATDRSRLGDINFIGCRIDRHRSGIVELSIASSGAAPSRKYLAIWAELNDSSTTLIDDINRVVRTDGDPSRAIKSSIGTFPLGDESPVGGQLLHTMIRSVRHIDIAGAIKDNAVRCS